MDWSNTRKIAYATSLVAVIVIGLIYAFRGVLFPSPTCNDGKQNGYESGIDCGGLCALRCKNEVTPISVEWTRILPVTSNTYDLAAFITNKNSNSAPQMLQATFTVLGGNGQQLFSKTINVIPPTSGGIPIMIQGVSFSDVPKALTVSLKETQSYVINQRFASVQLSTTNTQFENGAIPRVYATLTNITRDSFDRIPVRVVLYDAAQNAIGVGETIIQHIDKENMQRVVFTWKMPFTEAPTLIRVYPIFDPFSQ